MNIWTKNEKKGRKIRQNKKNLGCPSRTVLNKFCERICLSWTAELKGKGVKQP